MDYPYVSKHARLIKEESTPVVVPYGESPSIIQAIRDKGIFTRDDLRRLQPYMVSLRQNDIDNLSYRDALENLFFSVELLILRDGYYSPQLGLLINQRPMEDYVL